MENIKIDRTKLKSAKGYADMTGYSLVYVYRLMKQNKVKVVDIDGVKFIHL